MAQLVYQSAMDPAGILMLNSIRQIFEILNIPFNSMNFVAEQFDQTTIVNEIIVNKKCPVITAADLTDYFKSQSMPTSTHAMVTAGALKGSEFMPSNTILADQWFIKCKNSYGNDPTQPGKIQ